MLFLETNRFMRTLSTPPLGRNSPNVLSQPCLLLQKCLKKVKSVKQNKSSQWIGHYLTLNNLPIESQAAQAQCKRTMCFLVSSALYLEPVSCGNTNLILYRCTVKNVNKMDFFFICELIIRKSLFHSDQGLFASW